MGFAALSGATVLNGVASMNRLTELEAEGLLADEAAGRGRAPCS